MSTLERAIALAATAHAGQVDSAGLAYVLHPLRVMLSMRSNDERMVAVLHDVVEDTAIGLAQLAEAGFSAKVIAAVEALTKRPDETRLQAAARAAANPIALAVKLADNADNSDLRRIPHPTAQDLARLREYASVRAYLLAAQAAARPS